MAIVEDISTLLLSKALDTAVLRQQAIAQNIANVNTPGYRRLSVQFEAQMSQAIRSGQSGVMTGVIPRMQEAPSATGNEGTDLDLADLQETVLHHHVLLTVLDKRIGMISSAIREGKS